MTAATTHPPVSVEALERGNWGSEDFLEGQGIGMSAVGFTQRQFRGLTDDHPALLAWESMVDEVIAELEPEIRDLVYDRISRRLPWTWEPER